MVKFPPEDFRLGAAPPPEEKRVAPEPEVFKSSHLSPPKTARMGREYKISSDKKDKVFGTLANTMAPGASADKFVEIAAALLKQIQK